MRKYFTKDLVLLLQCQRLHSFRLWKSRENNKYIFQVQFSSVTQSCLTLCDPMDCSMPGFPVHLQLLKLAQTHVHQAVDAIQPSHPSSSVVPFSSCLQFFPASGSFPMSQFQWIRWPKYWSFSFSISPSNEYSGLISFRTDWVDLLAVYKKHKKLDFIMY